MESRIKYWADLSDYDLETANAMYLARSGAFHTLLTEADKEFIDLLEPLNIEARYPSDKERLFKSLTGERCSEILQNTRKLQQWIKQKL